MSKKNDAPKKKGSWFRRLFLGDRKELSFMEEEALESPGKTILKNFRGKRTAMFGLIVFVLIFIFVMVGPVFFPIDLGQMDSSLKNLGPGYTMMNIPDELLKNGVETIAPGSTFTVGVDKNGKVYTWGHTRITQTINIKDVPEEVLNAKIVDLAVGSDHVVAVDDQSQIYFWGNDRLGQTRIPSELAQDIRRGKLKLKQLEASDQFSAILTEDGDLYIWGNPNNHDLEIRNSYQGHIAKVALTDYAYIIMLDDGSVAYAGFSKDSPLRVNMPAQLENQEVQIVDIAATSQNAAAVDVDGNIYVWGNMTHGERDIPEMSSKPVKLMGGKYHYTALLEDGSVVSWGDNTYGQGTVPASVNSEGSKVQDIFVGSNHNYVLHEDGKVDTWGLKGFLCGTDALGRDVLTRIINGGKTTMTVGAIAVIISTIIGVLLGGLAGYFGGIVDNIVMRIAEIIGGLPFIPFAMILSAVVGSSMSTVNRMYMIMVVLGILSWPPICRLIRAQIFSVREQEYVTAAKTLGIKEGTIIRKHILPNVMSVLMVNVTLDFATCMLTESTLSYLGFGIPTPAPTWGNMLNGANNSVVIQQYWWQWVFPAAIFGLCTICINLIGDGLRDAIDPKSAER